MKTYTLLLLSFLFIACAPEGMKVNVLVVMSQEEGRRGAADIKELLPEAFSNTDILPCLSYVYLNQECDSTVYLKEVKQVVDSIRPDLVMLYGKPALCSYMKYCADEHPERPVAYAGITSTEGFNLSRYPSIKGYVSRKYFTENLNLIKRLFGEVEITLFYDHSPFRRDKRRELLTLIQKEHIGLNTELLHYLDSARTFEMKTFMQHLTPSKPFKGAYLSFWPVTAMTYKDNLNYLSTRHNSVYLSLGRLLVDINLSQVYNGPVMTTENFEMGHESGVLGGYFPTLETEVKDWVHTSSALLKGELIPQEQENRPDYVFDYREMQYLNLSEEQLPQDAVFINQSMDSYYGKFLFVLFVLILCLIVFLIFASLRYRFRIKAHETKIRQVKENHEWQILACLASGVLTWLYADNRWVIQGRKPGKIRELEKFVYTTSQLLECIHPEDRHLIRDIMKKGETTSRQVMQFRLKRSNSNQFLWYEQEFAVSRNEAGNLVILGFSYCIQEYKDEEQTLQENRLIIEKADLKRSFLMNMTNEIRQPLTNIVNLSTSLTAIEAQHLPLEERKEQNIQLKRNVDALLKLLEEILQISHIKAGETRFTYEYCELETLLEETCHAYRTLVRPELEFIYTRSQERMRVRVDRTHFFKIMSVLLSSADEFTHEGYVELGSRYDELHSEAIIYVKDSGVGVPEDKVDILFSHEENRKIENDGTMLELSLCDVIATKMDGHMSVESKLGKGSCFSLHLPCQKLMS